MQTTESQECRVEDLAVVEAGGQALFGPVHGMPLGMIYTLGFVSNTDGSRRWFPLRAFYAHTTRSFRPMEGPAGGDFTVAPEASDAYTGPTHAGQKGSEWGHWHPAGAPLLTVGDAGFRLREGEFLDLEGTLVGPGCQWFAQHPEHGIAYTSRPYTVRGRIRGEAVQGTFLVESAHMPEGKSFYPSPYVDGLQVSWFGFVNELEDGTWETGSIVAGLGGFEAMIVQHDGQVVAASGSVAATYEVEDRDPAFATRAEIAGGGETFVWEAVEGGRWPVMTHVAEGHRFRQGTMRRLGSDIPVRRSDAYMECYVTRMPNRV